MTISEKVAYLKGLAEGLDLDVEKSKEGKLISVMIGILEEMAMSIEDLEENDLDLGEEIDVLSDDLADVEAVVFGDEEDEDDSWDGWDEDDEEGFDFGDEDTTIYEVKCICGNVIAFDEETLEAGSIICEECVFHNLIIVRSL